MKTSYISHICARRRVRPQISAYFSGYIGKLGVKNRNPVINWKSSILISFKHEKTIIHKPRETRSEWIWRITAWSQSGEWRIRYGERCIRIRRVVYQNTDNSVSEPGEWSIIIFLFHTHRALKQKPAEDFLTLQRAFLLSPAHRFQSNRCGSMMFPLYGLRPRCS